MCHRSHCMDLQKLYVDCHITVYITLHYIGLLWFAAVGWTTGTWHSLKTSAGDFPEGSDLKDHWGPCFNLD